MDNKAIVCCPKCHEEAFEVAIHASGSDFDDRFGGVNHWFEGEGKCDECGHEGYYSESSL